MPFKAEIFALTISYKRSVYAGAGTSNIMRILNMKQTIADPEKSSQNWLNLEFDSCGILYKLDLNVHKDHSSVEVTLISLLLQEQKRD